MPGAGGRDGQGEGEEEVVVELHCGAVGGRSLVGCWVCMRVVELSVWNCLALGLECRRRGW